MSSAVPIVKMDIRDSPYFVRDAVLDVNGITLIAFYRGSERGGAINWNHIEGKAGQWPGMIAPFIGSLVVCGVAETICAVRRYCFCFYA